MEIKVRGERFKFNILRIILVLVLIYLFSLTCPYWYNKAQILIMSEKNPDWIPKEVMEESAVWGNSLSPDKNLLIVPYGEKKFTVYYETDIYSMSGLWSAEPNVIFSDENNLNYTFKTVDPIPVNSMPDFTTSKGKVSPYLKFTLNSDKEILHKIIKVNTNLELKYPQKISISMNPNYLESNISREFYLFFVSPEELPTIKSNFNKNFPEGIFVPYLIGFASILLVILLVINVKKLLREFMHWNNA